VHRVGQLVFDAMDKVAPDGIVCLSGVSSAGRTLTIDAGALNRELVLQNDVVFGTVNANRRHDEAAAAALVGAEGMQRRPDDVKTVIDFTL
jgi:glucose 1-dehydrogenase